MRDVTGYREPVDRQFSPAKSERPVASVTSKAESRHPPIACIGAGQSDKTDERTSGCRDLIEEGHGIRLPERRRCTKASAGPAPASDP